MSKKIDITHEGTELVLSWKWFGKTTWLLLFMSIFWNVIMFFVFAFMREGEGFSRWFLSLHIIAGAGLAYVTIAQMFNRTVIRVSHSFLSVRHSPIPWGGPGELRAADLKQLYAIATGHSKSNGKTKPIYAVKAIMKNGKTRTLINNIDNEDNALLIERQIEDYLNINDELVEAEENPLVNMLKKHFPDAEIPPLPGPINRGKSGSTTEGNVPPPRELPAAPEALAVVAVGDDMVFQEKIFQVTERVQYDWEDGRTDYRHTTLGEEQQTVLLFAEATDRGLVQYEERQLTVEEYEALGFTADTEPPARIVNGDDKYYARNKINGYRYTSPHQGAAVKQWIYFTTSGPARFRVLAQAGMFKFFIQEPLEV